MDEFDREVREYFQAAGRLQGMDESYLNVFATLYIEPDEISMEELAKKAGYSLASISNKIKLLESAGVVTRVKKPGTKRVYLTMEKDFLAIMRKQLVLKQEFMIRYAKDTIPAIIRKYEPKMKSKSEKKKLKIVENYYKQARKAEGMIPEILKIMSR